GFQHTLLEYARHVLGLSEAGHAEYGSAPETALITPAACEVPLPGDGPRLHGKQKVRLAPGSLARRLYGKDEVAEEFHCRNELNAAFQPRFAWLGPGPGRTS